MDSSDLLERLADDFASVVPAVDAEAEHDRWQAGIGPFEEERQVEMLREAVDGDFTDSNSNSILMTYKSYSNMEIAGHDFEGPYFEYREASDRRGVYVVLCLVDDEPHCILDVGESSKVGNRLKTHDRKSRWREHVHGEIGFCVSYTSYKGGVENYREYTPAAARKTDDEEKLKERHKLERELEWKLEYPCGSNAWKKIERKYEKYKEFEERFGPRGSYDV